MTTIPDDVRDRAREQRNDPDHQPSIEVIIDDLITDERAGYGRLIEITQNRMGGGVSVKLWQGDEEAWGTFASKHGMDWRDALRSAYRQVVGEIRGS